MRFTNLPKTSHVLTLRARMISSSYLSVMILNQFSNAKYQTIASHSQNTPSTAAAAARRVLGDAKARSN